VTGMQRGMEQEIKNKHQMVLADKDLTIQKNERTIEERDTKITDLTADRDMHRKDSMKYENELQAFKTRDELFKSSESNLRVAQTNLLREKQLMSEEKQFH
jgi:hypothetical protein